MVRTFHLRAYHIFTLGFEKRKIEKENMRAETEKKLNFNFFPLVNLKKRVLVLARTDSSFYKQTTPGSRKKASDVSLSGDRFPAIE